MSDAEIVEFFGGTNRCFSVSKGNQHYFIRLPGQRTSACGIRREAEFAAIQAVASTGIGAEPVYFSLDDGAMITAKVEGRQLTRREFSARRTIRRVVQAVRRIHDAPPVAYAFSPYSQIWDRGDCARRGHVALPGYLDDLMARLDEIEKRHAANSRKCIRLCHNDLIVENFIFSDSVRIIDWEYAGMGDVSYDLATLGMYFSKRRKKYLLKCYFGGYSRRDYEHLDDMIFVARFWNAMWAVMLDGGVESGASYRQMADKWFESIRKKSLLERCLQQSQIPRVLRKIRRILACGSRSLAGEI
jgi:aminoglycoside phosphotransferase (APT) family kinase protein